MKQKILIIEDEILVALELKQRIISWGYECTFTASTCDEAVQWALKNPPDLILADIFLKGGSSGIEAVYKIKKSLIKNKNSRIVVIFIGACIDKELMEMAKKTDPYCFLDKPLETQKLKFHLENALK